MTDLLAKKFKWHICYLKILKDLTVTNTKLKEPMNTFGLFVSTLKYFFEKKIFLKDQHIIHVH
jgi:hypothetical protein